MARIRKGMQAIRSLIWRVALYIRLSKEDGNDESLSVVNQRKILLEYIQNNSEEEYVIVDVYIEMITLSLIQLHSTLKEYKTLENLIFQAFFDA